MDRLEHDIVKLLKKRYPWIPKESAKEYAKSAVARNEFEHMRKRFKF